MANSVHPSVLNWPLNKNVKFPLTQLVKCAFCDMMGSRVVETRVQAKNLWYCTEEHKLARRRAVMAGQLKPVGKLPTIPVSERFDSEWGNLNLAPRRSIKSMRKPTTYDNTYGVLSTSGDLKE